jgi:hypothetical protein
VLRYSTLPVLLCICTVFVLYLCFCACFIIGIRAGKAAWYWMSTELNYNYNYYLHGFATFTKCPSPVCVPAANMACKNVGVFKRNTPVTYMNGLHPDLIHFHSYWCVCVCVCVCLCARAHGTWLLRRHFICFVSICVCSAVSASCHLTVDSSHWRIDDDDHDDNDDDDDDNSLWLCCSWVQHSYANIQVSQRTVL